MRKLWLATFCHPYELLKSENHMTLARHSRKFVQTSRMSILVPKTWLISNESHRGRNWTIMIGYRAAERSNGIHLTDSENPGQLANLTWYFGFQPPASCPFQHFLNHKLPFIDMAWIGRSLRLRMKPDWSLLYYFLVPRNRNWKRASSC